MLVHPDRNKIAADVDKFKNAFQRLNEAQNKLSVLADKRDDYVQRQRTPIPGFRPKS